MDRTVRALVRAAVPTSHGPVTGTQRPPRTRLLEPSGWKGQKLLRRPYSEIEVSHPATRRPHLHTPHGRSFVSPCLALLTFFACVLFGCVVCVCVCLFVSVCALCGCGFLVASLLRPLCPRCWTAAGPTPQASPTWCPTSAPCPQHNNCHRTTTVRYSTSRSAPQASQNTPSINQSINQGPRLSKKRIHIFCLVRRLPQPRGGPLRRRRAVIFSQ